MSGQLLTPNNGAPDNIMSVGVMVNNEMTPLPVAYLVVLNGLVGELKRVADVLEEYRDRTWKGKAGA